jgi:hypothetical protein
VRGTETPRSIEPSGWEPEDPDVGRNIVN